MKTYKNILLSGLLLFSLSSCSDWFQVEPENEIAKEIGRASCRERV